MDELEEMLRGDIVINNTSSSDAMDIWYNWLLGLDNATIVEVARLVISSLGFRYAGYSTSPTDGASREGMVHGMKCVLDLMKESLE